MRLHDTAPAMHEDEISGDPPIKKPGASEVYKIPKLPIVIGDTVIVEFSGKDGERPRHTVLICEDPKNTKTPTDDVIPIGIQSTLAQALLNHDPNEGDEVTYTVAGQTSSGKPITNTVTIIRPTPKPQT